MNSELEMKEKVLNTSDKQHFSETYYPGQFLNVMAEYDPNGEGSFVGLESCYQGRYVTRLIYQEKKEVELKLSFDTYFKKVDDPYQSQNHILLRNCLQNRHQQVLFFQH